MKYRCKMCGYEGEGDSLPVGECPSCGMENEWEANPFDARCSCGQGYYESEKPNFCPNCGARIAAKLPRMRLQRPTGSTARISGVVILTMKRVDAGTAVDGECKFCGAKFGDGAAFCARCGNAAGAERRESEWGSPAAARRASRPLPVMQKVAWGAVVAIAVYGICILLGGKIALGGKSATKVFASGSRDRLKAASAVVADAEEHLEKMKRAMAEEDARKKKAEEEAQNTFQRQLEEARRLSKEFSGKEFK